jgi:hypothetical protein
MSIIESFKRRRRTSITKGSGKGKTETRVLEPKVCLSLFALKIWHFPYHQNMSTGLTG